MHPVIWKEHDNSWTWSIEEGKAFEDDHQVLARDEGFATRGDAKEAMQIAWDRLLAEGKTPGRPGLLKPPPKTAGDDAAVMSSTDEAHASAARAAQLEWAIAVDGEIVAVFATQSKAREYGRRNYKGKYRLQRVNCTILDSRAR